MLDGTVQGLLRAGREPGRRLGATRRLTALAMASSTGSSCATSQEIESASLLARLARDRDRRAAHRGHRHRGVLAARRRAHREGRHVHEHPAPAAVAPQGGRAAGRLPLGPVVRVPPRAPHPREARRLDGRPRPAAARPHLGLPDCTARTTSPTPRRCCARSTASHGRRRLHRRSTTELRADGSTACGCWIYCGCYADGVNQTARKRPAHRAELGRAGVGLGVAGATGGSSTTAPRPTRRRAVVGAQALRLVGRRRRGAGPAGRRPRLRARQAAGLRARPEGATGTEALRGDEPFIMQADGRGWLFAPARPRRRPAADPLRAARVAGRQPALRAAAPTRRASASRRDDNPYHPQRRRARAPRSIPYVMTTYRLTEHHTAGGMSRTLPYLSELQPEMFCEVSPELAAERGSSTAAGRRSSARARRSRRACWSPTGCRR